MTNVSTAGYKAERYTDSTAFREVILSRVGNKDKVNTEEIGPYAYILAPDQQYTDFTQGSLEETELPLDFAIEGDGFFAIEWDGEVAYTRAGSFNLDDEGYLVLPGQGRVLDENRQPIQLPTDNIYVDEDGGIYTMANRNYLATLGILPSRTTARWSATTTASLPAASPRPERTTLSTTNGWSAPTPTWFTRWFP